MRIPIENGAAAGAGDVARQGWRLGRAERAPIYSLGEPRLRRNPIPLGAPLRLDLACSPTTFTDRASAVARLILDGTQTNPPRT
jgi:hypothetical protein